LFHRFDLKDIIMLTEFRHKKLKLFFQMLDLNHDGFVGECDLKIISQNLATQYGWGVDSEEFDDIQDQFISLWDGYLHLADRNGDDQVSEDEFLENFDRQFESQQGFYSPLFQQFLNTIFDILNVSGTGEVTPAEYVLFCRAYGLQAPIIEMGFQKVALASSNLSKLSFLRATREFFCSDDPKAAGNWIFGSHEGYISEIETVENVDLPPVSGDEIKQQSTLITPTEISIESEVDLTISSGNINISEEILEDSPPVLESNPITNDSSIFLHDLNYIQRKLEPILINSIGPIASIYLKHAASKANSIADLIDRLSQTIPSTDRAKMQEFLKAAIAQIEAEPNQDLEIEPPKKIKTEEPADTSKLELTQGFIDRCEQELMEMIGVMARVILRKALANNPASKQELVEMLTQQLPSQTHATMLRQRLL
jgi:hypothetical protein